MDGALTGQNAYRQWVCSAGTCNIQTGYRTFKANDTGKEVDKTAGPDTRVAYIETLTDGDITFSMLHDGGTLNWAYFKRGVIGTLTWGEAGTANGKPKHVQPATVKDGALDEPYDGVQIWNVTLRATSERTDSAWNNGA